MKQSLIFVLALLAGCASGFMPTHVRRSTLRCSAEMGNGPLVAVTRETKKTEIMVENLARQGVQCVATPCIKHEKGEDWADLPKQLQDMRWTYVAITSPESAVVLHGAWEAAGYPCMNIASIGDSTTQKLRSKGIEPAFQCSEANAESLGAELPKPKIAENSVLYPASAIAPDTLEDFLRRRGYEVKRMNVYTTVPTVWTPEEELAAKAAQIVAFGSPSAVESWAERVGNEQMAVCIGPTTAAACIVNGWENHKVKFPMEETGYTAWLDLIKQVRDEMAVSA